MQVNDYDRTWLMPAADQALLIAMMMTCGRAELCQLRLLTLVDLAAD